MIVRSNSKAYSENIHIAVFYTRNKAGHAKQDVLLSNELG